MREIPLSQGQVALVDDEDYERLSRFSWYASWAPDSQTFYARRSVGSKKHYMHRQILGARAGEQVDHKNHNGLDNRRENLRCCAQRQNLLNTRKRQACTSKYKGVYWNKSYGEWQARIKRRHLGFFKDEGDAALAYNQAAAAEFGEFAHLNEVTESAGIGRSLWNPHGTRKRANCSSRYKGVSWCKRLGKWECYITVRGKRRDLGRFDSEEAAALAYNRAASEALGEAAVLNEVAA